MSSRLPCPDCNDKASVQVFKDGTYCYACRVRTGSRSLIKTVRNKTPKTLQDLSFHIPDSGMQWLRKYKITDEDINRHRIGWSEEFQRVVFPYYANDGHVDAYQYSWMRAVDSRQPKWLYMRGLYGQDLPYWLRDPMELKSLIVITEDVVSAIRCVEYADALALGSLNFNKEGITRVLLEYDQIIIWLDGDEPGKRAAKEFSKKWRLLRPIRMIKTNKDPKEFTAREIREILSISEEVK